VNASDAVGVGFVNSITLLGGVAAWPLTALAQQPRIFRRFRGEFA
jgi:hypothetical protein